MNNDDSTWNLEVQLHMNKQEMIMCFKFEAGGQIQKQAKTEKAVRRGTMRVRVWVRPRSNPSGTCGSNETVEKQLS